MSWSVVPWLIRHAAYLIARCSVKTLGNTALQLMKGRTSLTKLVPFGEIVLFKIPKTGDVVRNSRTAEMRVFGWDALFAME